MRKIQMVDLVGQYHDIAEELKREFDLILESAAFINGPTVKEFEQSLAKYLQVKHVIGCANGTDALQIALMAMNYKPGDEIITTNFTFAATVEVIHLLGLKPILVDIDPKTFNIDIDSVKSSITTKTRAIMPVHLFGQVCPMDELSGIAMKNGLDLIEDNAQAIGAKYQFNNGDIQSAGTLGQFGTTSFFPAKNLGAYGDGGALFTNDDGLASSARAIANHGMSRRYYHDIIGVNSRLDTLQAAVLKTKLKYLDQYIERRQSNAKKYHNLLKDIPHMIVPAFPKSEYNHVWHQYTLRITNGQRDELAHHLSEHGIPFGIYYPVPLHKQKAYSSGHHQDSYFPMTIECSKQVLSLPMHTELTDEQINYIAQKVKDFLS
ncbi:MAG: DegT/DnrJ/EryC1/StrS family aminotransferase [Flavobacteriaceae bacterium]|nr:DegT/DnrJ/EryC1/StrS family aminotransferase [Flavobacteriaceae bacterium]